MQSLFRFNKIGKDISAHGYRYQTFTDRDAEWSDRETNMTDVGTHYSVSIKNNSRESIVLLSSLRGEPIVVDPAHLTDALITGDGGYSISIDIRYREVIREKNSSNKTKTQRKIQIRIPIRVLQNGSVFVEELGQYVALASRLDAVRELMAADVRQPDTRQVSVPETMVPHNPAVVLSKYEPLIRNCISRADKIQVRVGVRVDVDECRVPDYIKNFRVTVMDRDFSPYHNNRMTFDPTVPPDQFEITNVHHISSESYWGSFSALSARDGRCFLLDISEHETIKGTLVGLGLFADPRALEDYLVLHKSNEVFDELSEYVANRDGDITLRKRIQKLEATIAQAEVERDSAMDLLKKERDINKELGRIQKRQEATIKQLRTLTEPENDLDVVLRDREIAKQKIQLEQEKIDYELREHEAREKQAKQSRISLILKSTADIVKSSYGLAVTLISVSTAGYALYKKLKS